MREADRTTRLVVRTYAPVRRNVTIAVLALLGLFTLYIAFEIGRYRAGFDRVATARTQAALRKQVDALDQTNRQLRVQLAGVETMRAGQARERAEVSRTIGELQSQVMKQAQELALYQGIVGQDAAAPGARVQQLRIVTASGERRYRIKLTLGRVTRPDAAASGTIVMKVDGMLAGSVQTLDLASLGSAKSQLPYNFRYFQNFDIDVTVPEGFEPQRLTVEVRSNRRGAKPRTQTFLWTADT